MKLLILCEELLIIIPDRFLGIPLFRFCALADGIRGIRSRATLGPPVAPPASLQTGVDTRLIRLTILGKLLTLLLCS